MDARWINRQVNGQNNQHNNANGNLDLTLNLRLPSGGSDDRNQDPHGQANFNCYNQNHTQNVGAAQENPQVQVYGFVPNTTSHGHINLNNFIIRPNNTQGRNNRYEVRNNEQSNVYRFGGEVFRGFSSASAAPFYSNRRPQRQTNTSLNMNPNLPPLHAMNNYTILDHFPTRRVNRSSASSSSSSVGGSRMQECTNYNCRTTNTPMWRKGPLGPNSLCNACGLKYSRMERKRRASEAADRARFHDQEFNN